MKRIVDPYTTYPKELKAGDVMIKTVTLHVMEGPNDTLLYRMYECPYVEAGTDYGVPQGSRIYADLVVQQQLFPTVSHAGAKPDRC